MRAHLHLAPAPNGNGNGHAVHEPITIVLGEDHTAFRRNLRSLLDEDAGFELIGEATDIASVTEQVRRHVPRVLVLDLHLPDGSCLGAIRRLRTEFPDTQIVVLTMEQSPAFAEQAIDAGAVGFVVKDRAECELTVAIRRAAVGEEFVSPRVMAGLEMLREAGSDDGLSVRETEILRLIALGHTSAEIAVKLHLSRRTVETHRARIYEKLELQTRAQLVQYALGRHLVSI